MVRDYKELIEDLHYLKDKMKDLGLESIDLNSGGGHVAEFIINDAETYGLVRGSLTPEIKENHYVTFHLDGWATIGFVGMCEIVEREYQATHKETP